MARRMCGMQGAEWSASAEAAQITRHIIVPARTSSPTDTHPPLRQSTGIQVYGGQRASEVLGLARAPADKHEYGSLALTLELVASMEEAVDHIHQYGSGHTESIVTGDTCRRCVRGL